VGPEGSLVRVREADVSYPVTYLALTAEDADMLRRLRDLGRRTDVLRQRLHHQVP
jgi:hypothetical protein